MNAKYSEEHMEIRQWVIERTRQAKHASRPLSLLSTEVKNKALEAMANAIKANEATIVEANRKDLDAATQLSRAMVDRLTLTPKRIADMQTGLHDVAALPDPVGSNGGMWKRPNGLKIGRVRVPIGVIGIIYESRPNVTADTVGLCLKSGNAVVLRGGSEAIHSNTAIANILTKAAQDVGIPEGAIIFLENPDRQAVTEMLSLTEYIDLIIPRGGEGLMQAVTSQSKIPVIKHDKGVCHIYVDRDADIQMAQEVCFNAKVQRPGTCNAMEALLVHEHVAPTFLPSIGKKLHEAGIKIRGCPKTVSLIPNATRAIDNDWGREFLDLILAVKIVADMDAAMEHIVNYGSSHTESIITKNKATAQRFLKEVDASAVMVNASTRFNDGFQFGLGAEMGISTTRIHARGPMGLEELTCQKFIVLGNGQVRE
tara:strand:- start:1461 stop:2738 length:1278 start_codon:yes stop_codon:yes gene_type:complete